MSMLFGYVCIGFVLVLTVLLGAFSLGLRDVVLAKKSGSRTRAARGVVLLLIPLGVVAFVWNPSLRSAALCLQAPYKPPSATLDEYDLVGTWENSYADGSVERLVFRADGTYKQVYYEAGQQGEVRERPWNSWRLESLPSGGARVHLDGATYYPDGLVVPDLGSSAESCLEDDVACQRRYQRWPYAFYDPIAADTVPMRGALVLNVRVDPFGHLLLHHMRTGPTQLVVLTECEAEHFRLVERP